VQHGFIAIKVINQQKEVKKTQN